MNERILRVVEFDKISSLLMQQAETSVGKELARQVHPSSNIEEVVHNLNETDEAAEINRLNETIPFGGISDIRASVKRSVIGSTLSAQECLEVADTVRGGRRVKQFIESLDGVELPLLSEITDEIMPLKELQRKINECINEYAEVSDSASSALRSIRSSIRTFESRIRERLQSVLRSNSKMLSDAIITIRNDRYVLPVKSEYRSAVGGVVHDQSSSGQTLFMEPKSVVETNNQLQEAIAKEKQEIDRILRAITVEIASHASYLERNVTLLAQLDFISARAKLGSTMRAAKPQMNERGFIEMKQARHPLIPDDVVVANDVELGRDYRAILITGPNTGGKTVTLKMIGLCTLMAQSGLFVPAEEGLELAVFKEVFADIGDEQSIEQNLSTFSSHMTNIVSILKHFDDQSLVLFDELGAGTDPQEGAALAMSILDNVISHEARVVATTHYPELKAYGYNREHVVNASVEFDVETLQPTYRLLIGVPGRSNAFEISKRLGLSNFIIEDAKKYIDVEAVGVENMITSLDNARKQAEKDYEIAHETLLDAENLKLDLQKEWRDFERMREDLYKQVEEKAAQALTEAREEAERIVSDMRKMKTNVGMKEHEWIEARKQLEEAQPHLAKRGKQAPVEVDPSKRELVVGDEVKLIKLNREGIVADVISNKEYMVEVGAMKVKVKRKDLQFIRSQKQEVQQAVTKTKGTKSYVKAELDLRGERFEDALLRVEKYIDDAVLAGHVQVTIIHGKGTGALRKGVQEFVKTHPNVKGARMGDHGEGGSGVTVLELK